MKNPKYEIQTASQQCTFRAAGKTKDLRKAINAAKSFEAKHKEPGDRARVIRLADGIRVYPPRKDKEGNEIPN